MCNVNCYDSEWLTCLKLYVHTCMHTHTPRERERERERAVCNHVFTFPSLSKPFLIQFSVKVLLAKAFSISYHELTVMFLISRYKPLLTVIRELT